MVHRERRRVGGAQYPLVFGQGLLQGGHGAVLAVLLGQPPQAQRLPVVRPEDPLRLGDKPFDQLARVLVHRLDGDLGHPPPRPQVRRLVPSGQLHVAAQQCLGAIEPLLSGRVLADDRGHPEQCAGQIVARRQAPRVGRTAPPLQVGQRPLPQRQRRRPAAGRLVHGGDSTQRHDGPRVVRSPPLVLREQPLAEGERAAVLPDPGQERDPGAAQPEQVVAVLLVEAPDARLPDAGLQRLDLADQPLAALPLGPRRRALRETRAEQRPHHRTGLRQQPATVLRTPPQPRRQRRVEDHQVTVCPQAAGRGQPVEFLRGYRHRGAEQVERDAVRGQQAQYLKHRFDLIHVEDISPAPSLRVGAGSGSGT